MYNSYRGRSHTKKQHNIRKPKLSLTERCNRKQQKHLEKLFPNWKYCLPCYTTATSTPIKKKRMMKAARHILRWRRWIAKQDGGGLLVTLNS